MCVICGFLYCPSNCPEYDPQNDPWLEDERDEVDEETETVRSENKRQGVAPCVTDLKGGAIGKETDRE